MNGIVLYSFNIYMKKLCHGWSIFVDGNMTSSATIPWNTMITLYGSNLDEALKKMPEEFHDWTIINVDYPMGYHHYPLFAPSTCTVGAYSSGENYLRIV